MAHLISHHVLKCETWVDFHWPNFLHSVRPMSVSSITWNGRCKDTSSKVINSDINFSGHHQRDRLHSVLIEIPWANCFVNSSQPKNYFIPKWRKQKIVLTIELIRRRKFAGWIMIRKQCRVHTRVETDVLNNHKASGTTIACSLHRTLTLETASIRHEIYSHRDLN